MKMFFEIVIQTHQKALKQSFSYLGVKKFSGEALLPPSH